MAILNDKETLLAYIKNQCKRKLPSDVNPDVLDTAMKRHLVMQSTAWKELSEAIYASSFDPDMTASDATFLRLKENLDEMVSSIVSDVKDTLKANPNDSTAAERVLHDYFLPAVYDERRACAALLSTLEQKLAGNTLNIELNTYQRVVEKQLQYLDAIATLPLHLEKVIKAIQTNTGQNYTPRKNAQVIASLLDILQKSQASWTSEKLLQTLRLVMQLTMPDLPFDAETLEGIDTLLTCINELIDKREQVEAGKANLLPQDNPEQTHARMALLSSTGIQLVSFQSLCQDALLKPMDDIVNAASKVLDSASKISTEGGLDYLAAFRMVDEVTTVISGLPKEAAPSALKQYASAYNTAKYGLGRARSAMGYVATKTRDLADRVIEASANNAPERLVRAGDAAMDKAMDFASSASSTVTLVINGVTYLLPYHYTPYLPKQTWASLGQWVITQTACYVPPSVSDYVSGKRDPKRLFWRSLKKPANAMDPYVAEAYFHFRALAQASENPSLDETFFKSVMAKTAIPAKYIDYQQYTTFLDSLVQANLDDVSLDCKIALLAANNVEDESILVLSMLQRIKTLEHQVRKSDDHFVAVLNELTQALEQSLLDDTSKITAFREQYLKPALERCFVYFEQTHFLPLLEKSLDEGHEELRPLYNTLRAEKAFNGQELTTLLNAFPDIALTLAPEILSTTIECFSDNHSDVPKALTPKEESRQNIQTTLETIRPLLTNASDSLQKQRLSCDKLRQLFSDGHPLKKVCDAKIQYLTTLKETIDKLTQDISTDQILAEKVRQLVSGESLLDLSTMADAKTITKQLLQITAENLLPESEMVPASMKERVIAYALGHSDYLQKIMRDSHGLSNALNDTPPPPELMTALEDPLQAKLVFNGDLLGKAISGGLDMAKDVLIGTVARNYLTKAALTLVFPSSLLYGVVYDTVAGVLMRPSVKEALDKYLAPLGKGVGASIDERIGVSDRLSQQREKLAAFAKDYLAPKLGLEVQKVLESKALAYVKSVTSAIEVDQSQRDAFIGFYLQYRAIRQNNASVDKKACIAYLFPNKWDVQYDDKIIEQFDALDRKLLQTKKKAHRKQTSALHSELVFLTRYINFENPAEQDLVAMTLINQFLMMRATSAKGFSEKATRVSQQESMSLTASLLKQFEQTALLHSEPRQTLHGAPLLPAIQLADKTRLDELDKQLARLSKLTKTSIKNRDQLIAVDSNPNEPKILGQLDYQVQMDKATKTNLVWKAFSILFKLSAPLTFWPTYVMAIQAAIVHHSILTIPFTILGIAGSAAGSLGIAGVVILSVMAAIRITYTTIKEIRAHSQEFRAIKESNDPPLKKLFHYSVTGLKCFGLGLVKAVFLDTLYQKAAIFFTKGIKPIVDLGRDGRDLLRQHPTKSTLMAEKIELSDLSNRLGELSDLIKQHIEDKKSVDYDPNAPDPKQFHLPATYHKWVSTHKRIADRNHEINQQFQNLARDFKSTYDMLSKNPVNDARWKSGINLELRAYRAEFNKLRQLMAQIETIREIQNKMVAQVSVHEQMAQAYANQAQEQLGRGTEAFSRLNQTPKQAESVTEVRTLVEEIRLAHDEALRQHELADQARVRAGEAGHGLLSLPIDGPTTQHYNAVFDACARLAELKVLAEQQLDTLERSMAPAPAEVTQAKATGALASTTSWTAWVGGFFSHHTKSEGPSLVKEEHVPDHIIR